MSSLHVRRVVVLGVSGLIGRTLAKALHAAGHDVVGASRSAGEFRSVEAVTSELRGIDLRFGDLTSHSFARDVLESANIVICAAGTSGVAASFEDPVAATHGTVDIWQSVAAHLSPGTQVFTMSSQLVYGPSRGTPLTERDPVAPVSPYAQNLAWIEGDGRARRERGEISFVSLRLPNVFGEVLWLQKPRTHGLVALMLRDLLERGEIALFGGGDQRVNLLHVDDLARAISLVVESDLDSHVTFNIRGTSCTVRSVAEALSSGARSGNLVSRPWPEGMERAVANNIELDDSLFRSTYNWSPRRAVLSEIEQIARQAAGVARA